MYTSTNKSYSRHSAQTLVREDEVVRGDVEGKQLAKLCLALRLIRVSKFVQQPDVKLFCARTF